jgi:hypothetical protein
MSKRDNRAKALRRRQRAAQRRAARRARRRADSPPKHSRVYVAEGGERGFLAVNDHPARGGPGAEAPARCALCLTGPGELGFACGNVGRRLVEFRACRSCAVYFPHLMARLGLDGLADRLYHQARRGLAELAARAGPTAGPAASPADALASPTAPRPRTEATARPAEASDAAAAR